MIKIVSLIDNVHMGLSHTGLAKLARQFKKDPAKMAEGELLMFLNSKRDKLKIMGAGGQVIGYLKMPDGRRLNLNAIQYIPQTFGANGFSYEEALKTAIERELMVRNQKKAVKQLYYNVH